MTEKLAVGRPPREVVLDRDGIPSQVLLALEARAAGNSWKASAELGGIAVTSLREWRKLKVVRDTPERDGARDIGRGNSSAG